MYVSLGLYYRFMMTSMCVSSLISGQWSSSLQLQYFSFNDIIFCFYDHTVHSNKVYRHSYSNYNFKLLIYWLKVLEFPFYAMLPINVHQFSKFVIENKKIFKSCTLIISKNPLISYKTVKKTLQRLSNIYFLFDQFPALSIIIGVSVYSVNITLSDWDVSWCLFVCIVAFVATVIAFLILIVAACSNCPPELKQVIVPDPTTIYIHPTKQRFVMLADYSYPA